MTTTIVTIAIVLALAVAGVLGFAASKPDRFEIRRAASVNAPPEKIFPLINDLHAQASWSPFEKDPNMKRMHSGAPEGKGAVYEWDGNREVGAGRISIKDSTPSRIMLDLEMTRPFAARNEVEFTLVPNGGNTTIVTWAMRGPQPFLGKVINLFIDCEKMVGKQFEQGLANLKAIAEGTRQAQLQ